MSSRSCRERLDTQFQNKSTHEISQLFRSETADEFFFPQCTNPQTCLLRQEEEPLAKCVFMSLTSCPVNHIVDHCLVCILMSCKNVYYSKIFICNLCNCFFFLSPQKYCIQKSNLAVCVILYVEDERYLDWIPVQSFSKKNKTKQQPILSDVIWMYLLSSTTKKTTTLTVIQ